MKQFQVFSNGTIAEDGALIAKAIQDPETGKRLLHLRDENGPVRSGRIRYTETVADVTHVWHKLDELYKVLREARSGSQ